MSNCCRFFGWGACGPAITAAMVSVAACAATDLKLDLARPVPIAEYRSRLGSLRRCDAGSMHIAYAFGEAELTAVPDGRACAIRIAITGELTEGAQPQRFSCAVAILEQIDWLQTAGSQREQPPAQELRDSSSCVAQ
jgi:hypothetical protein